MQLPEIEREKILGERLEDMQRIQDKRNLDQMLKAQTKGGDSESVSKAAKRLRYLDAVLKANSHMSCLYRPASSQRCYKGEDSQARRAPGEAQG